MTRDDDADGRVPGVVGREPLDPWLQEAFDDAFVEEMPVDVAARHLWQLYRSARPTAVDGLAAAPPPGRLRRLSVVATLGAVMLLFPGLLGQASLDALPGDILYPAKRQFERAQLDLSTSWAERDAVLVDQARLRLLEAQTVARTRPRRLAGVVAEADLALRRLSESPRAGSSAQADALRADAAQKLAELADMVDERTRVRLEVAIDDLSRQEARGIRVVRSRPATDAGARRDVTPADPQPASRPDPPDSGPSQSGPSQSGPSESGPSPDSSEVSGAGGLGAPASPTVPATGGEATDGAAADGEAVAACVAEPGVVADGGGANDAGSGAVGAVGTEADAAPAEAGPHGAAEPVDGPPVPAAATPDPSADADPSQDAAATEPGCDDEPVVTESAEPAEPAEATDATDATEPTEAADPTDPTDAGEATEATDATDATEAAGATDATGAAEAAEATEPAGPADEASAIVDDGASPAATPATSAEPDSASLGSAQSAEPTATEPVEERGSTDTATPTAGTTG